MFHQIESQVTDKAIPPPPAPTKPDPSKKNKPDEKKKPVKPTGSQKGGKKDGIWSSLTSLPVVQQLAQSIG
jgi:hypothetical protein